jgi:hypothetical protein
MEILLTCVPPGENRNDRRFERQGEGRSPFPPGESPPRIARMDRHRQGPSSAFLPSSTVKVAPHFGHFTFASLLTISRCIPAHPAKLTDNANANIKFVNRFISRTPFPLHDGWHIDPMGILASSQDGRCSHGNLPMGSSLHRRMKPCLRFRNEQGLFWRPRSRFPEAPEDQRGPARLVARAESFPRVPVEIFVEEQQVAPVRVHDERRHAGMAWTYAARTG